MMSEQRKNKRSRPRCVSVRGEAECIGVDGENAYFLATGADGLDCEFSIPLSFFGPLEIVKGSDLLMTFTEDDRYEQSDPLWLDGDLGRKVT